MSFNAAAVTAAAVRAVRRPRLSPYGLTALLLALLLVPVCLRLPWWGDIAQHAGTVERLKASLSHPRDPLVDVALPDGSPYFSPQMVTAALVARALGWTGLQTLRLCALVNLALLLHGVRRFAAVAGPGRWTPVLGLAGMLLLWGRRPGVWSGYLSLDSLVFGLSYPSAFAFGLMLLLAAEAARGLPDGWAVLRLGLMAGLLGLCHPQLAIGGAVLSASLLLGPLRRAPGATLRRAAAAALIALSCLLFWPYGDMFDAGASGLLDPLHRALYVADGGVLGWYGLGLVALPALLLRLRRERLDPLVLSAGVFAVLASYGWVSHHYVWGRFFGLLLLALQFALAAESARPGRGWSWWRIGMGAVTAAALVVGLWAQLAGMPGFRDNEGRYDWALGHIRAGDVVLAGTPLSENMLPAYGAFTVAPAWPDPALPPAEQQARRAATRLFFRPGADAAERAVIVRRYHPRWAVADRRSAAVLRGEGYRVAAVDPRSGETLFRVDAPGAASPGTGTAG